MTNFFSLRRSIDLVELVRAMIFFSISLRSAGKINAKTPSICSRRPALYMIPWYKVLVLVRRTIHKK